MHGLRDHLEGWLPEERFPNPVELRSLQGKLRVSVAHPPIVRCFSVQAFLPQVANEPLPEGSDMLKGGHLQAFYMHLQAPPGIPLAIASALNIATAAGGQAARRAPVA